MTEFYHTQGHDRHRVVIVEYQDNRPFSVTTATESHCGHRVCHWNFEWCKNLDALYFYESGCGGELCAHVHPFANPVPPPCQIWIAEGVPVVVSVQRDGNWIDEPVNDCELLAIGYQRIPEPLEFGGESNPFE